MQFLPQWSQNVSKFILFHKWTAIFSFNINFIFFYKFLYFWNVFADISKCGKSQTWVTGTDVTQKRYILFTWFLVDICRRPISTKPWACFDFFFQILNYVIKFPDWPLPGYHGNRVKNPASWFCANCSNVPPSQFWKYCANWFLSYVCYRVWPIRGLAWLPWQPDWNDNHFQKVRVMGFVVVYHSCGLAFRKVLKFDVENWAVDHWTPPPP